MDQKNEEDQKNKGDSAKNLAPPDATLDQTPETMSIDQLIKTKNSLYKKKLPVNFVDHSYGEPASDLTLASALSSSINQRLGPEKGRLYFEIKYSTEKNNELAFVCQVRGYSETFEITAKDVGNDSAFLSRLITTAHKTDKDKERLFNAVSKLCKGHLRVLEDRVLQDYSIELSTPTCNQEKVDWKLKLIRSSGFSPLEWAAKPTEFERNLAFLEKNKDQILRYMVNQLKTLETTYEHDRTKGEHGVFWKNFSKQEARKGQLATLKSIATDVSGNLEQQDKEEVAAKDPSASLADIIYQLNKVKIAIEAEKKLWSSELTRKIDRIFTDCFDETKFAAIKEPEKKNELGS